MEALGVAPSGRNRLWTPPLNQLAILITVALSVPLDENVNECEELLVSETLISELRCSPLTFVVAVNKAPPSR